MDLEKLRKINSLSNELKKHRMAENSTDAYAQAQQIIQIMPKQNNTATTGETTIIETAPEPLATRQFQLEIERVQKEFATELDIMRNAMNQVITELNQLREELAKVQVQPQKQKEKQVVLKTETREPHPRQGDWKPGDVDIQKMFYFGTKR